MVSLAPLLALPHLEADLARVEVALRRAVEADDPFLSQVAGHQIPAGGKRLRPALALCAGQLDGGPAPDDVVMGACAVELVHLGSLYHDDVMDEARTRRNVESVNARWGNLVAILAGDFLLARASEIAASLGTEVAGLLAATIGRLCEGQVLELSQTFDVDRTEDAYLSSIAGKTAALMATACRIGGLTARAPRPAIEALTAYGQRLGMVFQIVDDILDVVATEQQLGKPAGNDLVEGVYTLPVIRALAHDEAGQALRRLLGGPIDAVGVDEARALVRADGAVASALDVARRYAAEADLELARLTSACGDGSRARKVAGALGALPGHLIAGVPAPTG
ncbi:MAG TPA: polyprenyl synthetase family protein [Acidimicrobiales bacterium]|nr:polyprenyl synthetase family protein [Acidimicrobiales bacterium]